MALKDIDQLFAEALEEHFNGKINEAVAKYTEILQRHGMHEDTLHHLGLAYLQLGDLDKAVSWIKKSLQANYQQPDALSNLSYCLNLLGKYEESEKICEEALKLEPNDDAIWTNLGNAQRGLKLTEAAQYSYERALKIKPYNPSYIYNLANTHYDQENYEKARDLFKQCLSFKGTIPEAHNNLSACYLKLNDFSAALKHANLAIELQPSYANAWSNRGTVLSTLNQNDEALASYESALHLKKDNTKIYCDYADLLCKLRRYDEALISYEKAIELKDNCTDAWSGRAAALSSLRRYEEALASYEMALSLDPELDFVFGELIHTRMKICEWGNFDSNLQKLKLKIVRGYKASTPFPILSLFDSPDLQQRVAQIYTSDQQRHIKALGPIPKNRKHEKIRVGYFSMDFREHPVSHLTVEVFERHDRREFEVIGISFGGNTREPIRSRIEKAFDKFYDVTRLSDLDVSLLSRRLEIDIAIDLGGHTEHARQKIFMSRAAPIQISYLGYPGTWGHSCIDYFIGDDETINEKNSDSFTEKIISLRSHFQANPSQRLIDGEGASRSGYGIDQAAFVFCCFNNTWKITPDIFSSWMRILKRIPGAVLWLYAENVNAIRNLKAEAWKQGVSEDRLIFAPRLKRERYLAQYKFADLFLDTFPYNAGTTASDALWAGLPVLTCKGETFVSRMASSLIRTVGLPELITYDLEEYENLAIELASVPGKLGSLKERLADSLSTSRLFDCESFTKDLESAYKKAYKCYQEDEAPRHISVNTP